MYTAKSPEDPSQQDECFPSLKLCKMPLSNAHAVEQCMRPCANMTMPFTTVTPMKFVEPDIVLDHLYAKIEKTTATTEHMFVYIADIKSCS